jgi:Sigma-70 region 2
VGVTRTDGELLAAAARGDGAAFGCFYCRHERRVLAYAVGHCIGASDVADLVAETFLQALVSAGRFRSTDGDTLPWLPYHQHMCRNRQLSRFILQPAWPAADRARLTDSRNSSENASKSLVLRADRPRHLAGVQTPPIKMLWGSCPRSVSGR